MGPREISDMARKKAPAKKRPPVTKGVSRKGTQPSSTGKVRNVKADQTTWRTKLQASRIKFDDAQKQRYLACLREQGLKGRAAQAAGVSQQTVNTHRENDPDFDEAVEAALEEYNDLVSGEVGRRGKDGWLEPVFQKGMQALVAVVDPKTGEVLYDKDSGKPRMRLSYIRKFSDRLLELEAKRVNTGYRDKQTIDLNNTGGGVLVAPAGMSPEEAVAEGERANEEARKRRAAEEAELAKEGK